MNDRSRKTRHLAVLAVWFAATGIFAFLSVTGLPRSGVSGYLALGIALLMFSLGVVVLWPGKQAGNPDRRRGRQAAMRWLATGLVALVWAGLFLLLLQSALNGRYLSAMVLLIFLWAVGQALWDQVQRL